VVGAVIIVVVYKLVDISTQIDEYFLVVAQRIQGIWQLWKYVSIYVEPSPVAIQVVCEISVGII
jgi:hypothetical protein